MRMLFIVHLPHEPFNTMVQEGNAGDVIEKILKETQPEAVYFTEQAGCRGAVMVINMKDQSEIPFYAEPWFLNFEADCEFRIAMTPEDLQKADLNRLGAKWSKKTAVS